MRLIHFTVYVTGVLIVSVALCNASDHLSVQWGEVETLNAAKKEAYETLALDVCRKAEIPLSGQSKISACYNDFSEFAHLHLSPRVELWIKGKGVEWKMGFFPPDNLRLASLRNVRAQRSMHAEGDKRHDGANRRWKEEDPSNRKGEFHTYIKKMNKEPAVIERGEKLLSSMANVDLGNWQFFSCYYMRGGWTIWYKAKVGRYIAPAYHLKLVLADNDTLDVVSFSNNAYTWPEPQNKEVRVPQDKAKELGEQYLKKYYHQQELATLEFSTNKLEIIAPNYAFTPQDQGDDAVTNALSLAWVSVFERKNNTLTRTPVFIFVDAGDGSMLGGYE